MSAEWLLPQTRASHEERAQATDNFKAVGLLENSYSNYILFLKSNVKFGFTFTFSPKKALNVPLKPPP